MTNGNGNDGDKLLYVIAKNVRGKPPHFLFDPLQKLHKFNNRVAAERFLRSMGFKTDFALKMEGIVVVPLKQSVIQELETKHDALLAKRRADADSKTDDSSSVPKD